MLLEVTIMTALISTALLICAKKWGVLTQYEIYRKSWMPKPDCYFCLGFWLSLPSPVMLVVDGKLTVYALVIVPLAAAPIVNYLTNIAFLHDYRKN